MSFIGILSENKSFENIKAKVMEVASQNKFNSILINQKSIENMKNIKFDVVVIDSDWNKLEGQKEILKQIAKKSNYILINTDVNKITNEFEKEKVITYGLNQRAIVTISSITDSDILIYVQKHIKTKQNKVLEIEEKRLKINEKCKLKTYEILILYTIFLLYNNTIMEEI